MSVNTKQKYFPSATVFTMFIFVGIFRVLCSYFHLADSFSLFCVETIFYFGSIICWSIYAQKSILSKRLRILLQSLALFMLLYIFIRIVKYRLLIGNDFFGRFTWYSYYVPQVLATYLTFIIAYHIGKPENSRLPKVFLLPVAVGVVIIALFLTNDLHRLAFSFNENFEGWDVDYQRGVLFYISTIWIYFWLMAALVTMYKRCRTINKSKAWIPVFWLALGSAYILFTEGISLISPFLRPYKLPEIHCFIVIAMVESCIRLGLLPSNIAYSDYIAKSSAAIQIADYGNKVIYSSENVTTLTDAQMENAKGGEVSIDKNTLLHSESVRGGNIFWTEDITAVNEMNEELSEISEKLSEESDLIKAENDIREQRAKIDAKNRLYDKIYETVSPSLDEISRLLNAKGDFNENMAFVCVINCYVKRRSNLTLLADNYSDIKAMELQLALSESVKYLELCGVSGFVSVNTDSDIPSDFALAAYDLWQHCIQWNLRHLRAVMVNIFRDERGFTLKITLENGGRVPDITAFSRDSFLCSSLCEDTTVYVTAFSGRESDLP